MGVGIIGVILDLRSFRQVGQLSIKEFISVDSPGHHTDALASARVFTIP